MVDGIAGKYTLRALEIAAFGKDGRQVSDLPRGVEWAKNFGIY